MPSRRSHTNSHHGCAECKSGRVKCDESKPRCSRCQKKGTACTYRHLQSEYDPFQAGVTKGSRDRARNKTTLNEHNTPRTGQPRLPGSNKQVDQTTEKLYEYYLQSVSPILSRCSADETLPQWDRGIKLYAADHPHLYHSIAAFSASHLAHITEPVSKKQANLALAIQHQTQALNFFFPLLRDISGSNYDAATVSAVVIMMCALAIPLAAAKIQVEPFDAIEELVRAFALFDGIAQLSRRSWDEDLPISLEVRSRIRDFRNNQADIVPDAEAALDEVVDYLATIEDSTSNSMYPEAISYLKNVYRRLAVVPDNQSVVLLWPSVIR